MNIMAENRYLFLGVLFTIAAAIGWILAVETYATPVGIPGDANVSLEQVRQYRALFPEDSVRQWLGPERTKAAEKQLSRYRTTFTASLVCGFLAVFSLALHLDALRADVHKPALVGGACQDAS